MNKKILIGLGMMAFLMALVFAVEVGISREDKTINVTIKDSGNISYEDKKFEDYNQRKITSDGSMRLNLRINVPQTYRGCETWNDTMTSYGENITLCIDKREYNYTDLEVQEMFDKETRKRMLNINETLDRRARENGIVIREGSIGDGRG